MISAIIISFFILGMLVFLKRLVGLELFDPIFITPLYWFVFVVFSILISTPLGLKFYWAGVVPIFSFLLAFVIGSIVMRYLIVRSRMNLNGSKNPKSPQIFPLRLLFWLIIGYSGLGFLAIMLQMNYLGISIQSMSDLFQSASKISEIRYNMGTDMPKYGLLLMSFLYSASFFGGIYWVLNKSFLKKTVALLPFVVIIIFTITNGVKAGFLFMLIIWLSGFLSATIFIKRGRIKNYKRILFRGIFIFVFVMLLLPVTQFFRSGNNDKKMEFITPGIISYFVSFNAFTIWYHNYDNSELTGYKRTLSGIHNLFYGEREKGLYGSNETEVGKFNNAPVTTNVFTMTRGLIEDFNFYGAMLLLFITGMTVQFLYFLTKKKHLFALCFLSLFYSILFSSFAQNIINYNTILFSWMVSFLSIFIFWIISFIRNKINVVAGPNRVE